MLYKILISLIIKILVKLLSSLDYTFLKKFKINIFLKSRCYKSLKITFYFSFSTLKIAFHHAIAYLFDAF